MGNPAILLIVPRYLYSPNYVLVQFTYTLIEQLNFVSVFVDPVNGPIVRIESSNPLDFGTY